MMRKQLLLGISVCLLALCLTQSQAQLKGTPRLRSLSPDFKAISKPSGKVSPELENLALKQSGAEIKGAPSSSAQIESYMRINGDKVAVKVLVKDGEEGKAALKKLGLEETEGFARLMTGMISISALSQLQASPAVISVKPAFKPAHGPAVRGNTWQKDLRGSVVNSVSKATVTPVVSQGDTSMYAYLARKKYNVSGKGVKVGIISDSYDDLETADIGVKAGELPGKDNPFGYTKPVQILEDLGGGGTDEGRGMAEIVHDVAPGAELAFHTAFISEPNFAKGIVDLADAGCKVIVDDIFYYDEPSYQDGIVAQAVDKVKKKGVSYFSSAGNGSNYAYESPYRPSGAYPLGILGEAHNFSAPTDPPNYFLPIYIPSGYYFYPWFQWDQPYYSLGGTGAVTDLDFYLFDVNGKIVAFDNFNDIGTDPYNYFFFANYTSSNTFFLAIVNHEGPEPGHISYIDYGYSDFYITDPPTPGIYAGTVKGHANAAGAIATAAAPWFRTPAYGVNPPRVEYFSSLAGTTPILFNTKGQRIKPVIRLKPEITAPDGGNTSFFPPAIYYGDQDISLDTDTFPNFFGTSAAAPHAAAVAALMIEARKGKPYTPDQVKYFLAANTVDMDNIYTPGFDKGFDYNTGTGLIRADAAVGAVYAASKKEGETLINPEITDNTDKVEIYPNPSVKSFKVHLSLNNAENASLTLYSVDGKVVYKSTGKSKSIVDIDASGYKPGIYILKVRQGQLNKTFKLIKE